MADQKLKEDMEKAIQWINGYFDNQKKTVVDEFIKKSQATADTSLQAIKKVEETSKSGK